MQSPFSPIQGIPGLQGANPISAPGGASMVRTPSAEQARSFGDLLGSALNNANSTLDVAYQTTNQLLDGSMENLHEMTVAGAKAEVMLHLTTQIASKLSSATTTLFQMQL